MSTDIFASLDIKKATKKQTINVTPNAFSNTSILFLIQIQTNLNILLNPILLILLESSTPKTPTTTPANVGITTNATDSDNTNVNIVFSTPPKQERSENEDIFANLKYSVSPKNSPKISSHDLFSPASPSKISKSSDSSSQQFNFNEQTNFNQTENEQSKSNANDLQDFFNISPNQKEQSDSQKKQTTNSIDAALGFDGQTEQKKEEVQMINGKCESLTIDLVNAWAFEKGTTQRKNLRSLLRNLDEILWTDCKWKKLTMSDLCDAEGVVKYYKKAVVLIHPDKNQARDQDQLECAQLLFDHVRMSYNIFRKQEMK
ncbi:hypothetical protein QTN25_010237 [Entamoeba marina]